MKSIILINVGLIFYTGVHIIAKISTNTGIHVVDFAFVRQFSSLICSLVPIVIQKKYHVLNEVPKGLMWGVIRRCISGTVSFVMLTYSLQMLPIFIVNVIRNTMPFWTSLLVYLFLKDKVSKYDLVCMVGCFIGVVVIGLSKYGGDAEKVGADEVETTAVAQVEDTNESL